MIQLRSVERLRKAAENDEGEILRLLIEEGASLEAQLQAVKPLPVYSCFIPMPRRIDKL